MKRLLAAGSGAIFQLCKAFRAGEFGSHHNPEFTILEWYRPGFGMEDLMTEVADLVALAIPGVTVQRRSYYEELRREAGVHPEQSELSELRAACERHGAAPAMVEHISREDALDFILSQTVQPKMAGQACFLTGFPVTHASMAKPDPDNPGRALRFELYVDGLELVNGYEELQDREELERRTARNQAERGRLGLPAVAPDESLLAAMAHGLPACSGVAVGVDRLLMAARRLEGFRDVVAFDIGRA